MRKLVLFALRLDKSILPSKCTNEGHAIVLALIESKFGVFILEKHALDANPSRMQIYSSYPRIGESSF